MDVVKSFNDELSGIYEAKPPISRAKMSSLTKKAIKGIKFYKHIVQSVEKFVQKCRPEYKVPGLYVIDSVVRQSRHQFGAEKDVFMPRLCKNIITTFQHIYKCPEEDKPRILRVLNLWQKNSVFPQETVQQLIMMGGAPSPPPSQPQADTVPKPAAPDAANLTNILTHLLANPDTSQIQNLAGLLSNSQQNQLNDLLYQIKGNENVPSKEENKEEVEVIEETVFQQPSHNSQPPFLHHAHPSGQPPFLHSEPKKPAFNREVLDFDYSDDEKTPPATVSQNQRILPPATHNQRREFDPASIANLPTHDQLQQLSMNGALHNPPRPPPAPPSNHQPPYQPSHQPHEVERMRRLEAEQEQFNMQIEQMASEKRDPFRGPDAKRRRSRSRSRSRSRDRHRNRSHHSREKSHRSRRSRSRSRDRSRRSRRSRSHEKKKKGMVPPKEGTISVLTTTLWIGNISSKVLQHELKALVEEFGEVESINMIPPRGCAYICMKQRADASKAIGKIRHTRLAGKSLKCDWAPSKEMPEDQKETWVKEHGVNYVVITNQPGQLKELLTWGFIDPESLSDEKKAELLTAQTADSEPEETPETPQITPVLPSFNPTFVSAPGMVPMGQQPMQMMVRPGFSVNPFQVSQPMSFPQQPQIRPEQLKVEVKPVEKEGSGTPTRDEQTEALQHSMPQFQPQFGGVPMAQRFPRPMPMQQLQIRMMPGMGQQLMQPRMGVMPIRMGFPMQLRHGFHPNMGARMPMQGGPPQMMQHQLPPHIRPMGGFQGHMPMMRPTLSEPPTQLPIVPDQITEGRQPDEPRVDTSKPPSDRGPSPSEEPRDIGPPRGFDRGSRDRDGPRNMDRGMDRDRGRSERGRGDMNRPPRDFERGPPRNMRRSPPPREFDRRPRDGDRDRRSRDMKRSPPRDFDRSRDRYRDRRENDRRDMDRGPRGQDRNDDRDWGPPRGGFRGRGGGFDRGQRGFDRGFSRGGGRGRGGWGSRPDFRRSPSIDPEEEEYNRQRQEKLKKRHEEDDEYVVEKIDFSSFGLPCGFGGAVVAEAEEPPKQDQEEKPKRHHEGDENENEKADLSSSELPTGFGGAREEEEQTYNRRRSPRRENNAVENEVSRNNDEPSASVAEDMEGVARNQESTSQASHAAATDNFSEPNVEFSKEQRQNPDSLEEGYNNQSESMDTFELTNENEARSERANQDELEYSNYPEPNYDSNQVKLNSPQAEEQTNYAVTSPGDQREADNSENPESNHPANDDEES